MGSSNSITEHRVWMHKKSKNVYSPLLHMNVNVHEIVVKMRQCVTCNGQRNSILEFITKEI